MSFLYWSPEGRFSRTCNGCHPISPVRPLTEDKLIQIDRDDQGFRCGMAVWLAREDSSLRRKDDARELFEIGDVVCGRRTATDLDLVVVPLQQSSVTEVQCLLCTVGRDIRGKADFQTTAFRLLLATARRLQIQRRVRQGETEYLDTSTSRTQRSMRAANHSRGFRERAHGTMSGVEGVLQVPCHLSRSRARPVEVRSETFDPQSQKASEKPSRCEGLL